MTAKESALDNIPLLKAVKDKDGWKIMFYTHQYGETCSTSSKAWESALVHINKIKFKQGDLVVMQNCMEAANPKQKVWKCRTDSYPAATKDTVVFLENYSGYFLCYFLRLATPEEISEYESDQEKNRSHLVELYEGN